MRFFLSWFTSIFFNAIALFIVSQLFSSFYIDGFATALLAGLVISILNVLVRPLLILFTLPATILTLGLFLFVINAITLMMTQGIMGDNFVISNFGVAILAAIIISIINSILSNIAGTKDN